MKIVRKETGRAIFNAFCFLLLFAVLTACRFGPSEESNNSNNRRRESGSSSSGSKSEGGNEANAELCRKYDSCGCQSYDDCMKGLENDRNIEKPGVRECMLNSSCQSLCAGKPDGCTGQSGSTGAGSGGTQPRSNCAAIPCSNKSDCPTDCYGGCDGVRCYSF
jgi:hypothetical protein